MILGIKHHGDDFDKISFVSIGSPWLHKPSMYPCRVWHVESCCGVVSDIVL